MFDPIASMPRESNSRKGKLRLGRKHGDCQGVIKDWSYWRANRVFGQVIPPLKFLNYLPQPLCLLHRDAQDCLLNLIGNIRKGPSTKNYGIIGILCLLCLLVWLIFWSLTGHEQVYMGENIFNTSIQIGKIGITQEWMCEETFKRCEVIFYSSLYSTNISWLVMLY